MTAIWTQPVSAEILTDLHRETAVARLGINANHIRGPRAGWVTGTARPLHRGRGTQVWQIELVDDDGRLVCSSRLTAAIVGSAG